MGDVHSNALAVTQILSKYDPHYYELVWLGDFINSKKPHTSDKEVEYVLLTLLERCEHYVHSNHMHILFQYLHQTVINPHKSQNLSCFWNGWAQTKRVVDSLHPSIKRQLYKFIEKSKYVIEVHHDDLKIIAAHSSPRVQFNHLIKNHLDDDQAMTIGMKAHRNFWKDREMRHIIDAFDYVICGHHGFISRLGNVRICDNRGIQVPTWNPVTDEFRLFPQ